MIDGITHEDHPEYAVWRGLKQRCFNPKDKDFRHYGGRGIKVCERWLADFPQFLADMGRRPSTEHSIDRIENDGDYEPGNCRWVTIDVQIRNRSIAQILTVCGVSMNQSDWAAETGVSKQAIRERMRRGWSHESAVLTPVGQSTKSPKPDPQPKPVSGRFTDIQGRVFGRLSVEFYCGKRPNGHHWWCNCECGQGTAVSYGDLNRKQHATQSCGCLSRQKSSKRMSARSA